MDYHDLVLKGAKHSSSTLILPPLGVNTVSQTSAVECLESNNKRSNEVISVRIKGGVEKKRKHLTHQINTIMQTPFREL